MPTSCVSALRYDDYDKTETLQSFTKKKWASQQRTASQNHVKTLYKINTTAQS